MSADYPHNFAAYLPLQLLVIITNTSISHYKAYDLLTTYCDALRSLLLLSPHSGNESFVTRLVMLRYSEESRGSSAIGQRYRAILRPMAERTRKTGHWPANPAL